MGIDLERRDSVRAEFIHDGFEAVAPFAQRKIKGELAAFAEQIEDHEDDGHLRSPLIGDALAPDALAEHGEGKGVCGPVLLARSVVL